MLGFLKRSQTVAKDTSQVRVGEQKYQHVSPVWMPYTLRWWYFVILGCYTLALGLTVIILQQKSANNYGLGNDDGSSSLLFGWRFTPTIFAVIYSQMAMMLFEDVKRTEPYALMARPGGSKASITILDRPRVWWRTLSDACKKRDGGRSWSLFFICLTHIAAFLAIAPLSSSILTSEDVVVPEPAKFRQMVAPEDSALSLTPQTDTRIRTTGNIMQNVTTSPWIKGPYTIFPVWPSDMDSSPFSSILRADEQSWEAETTVYEMDYRCNETKILHVSNSTYNNSHYLYSGDGESDPVLQTDISYPIILDLEEGECEHKVLVNEPLTSMDYFWKGGSQWVDLRSVNHSTSNPNRCGYHNGHYLFATSIWDEAGSYRSYKMNESTVFRSWVCKPDFFYQENAKVTVSVQKSETLVNFDEVEYRKERKRIPDSVLNTTWIKDYGLEKKWGGALVGLSALTDRFDGNFDTNHQPVFGGPTDLLISQFDSNLTKMLESADVAEQAGRIQERMFSELIQASITQQGAVETREMDGKILRVTRRIVVIKEMAITLASLLFLSLVLQGLVFWLSRLHSRPLQLERDPSSALGQGRLISANPRECNNFSDLDRASTKDIKTTFADSKFELQAGNLARSFDGKIMQRANTESFRPHRPASLSFGSLTSLLLFIVALIVGIAVLYSYSQRDKLYGTIFVYERTFSFMGASKLAPYSIIPTLFGIILSLWYESLEKSFKGLQPYLSMALGPTPIKHSSGLSYQGSYLAWATGKAVMNKHWLLAVITTGSTLIQIFVIAMSALFEREPGTIVRAIEPSYAMESRTVPFMRNYVYDKVAFPEEGKLIGNSLTALFTELPSNWIYSATLHLTMNGSEPGWSKDGWSFTPARLPELPKDANSTELQNSGDEDDSGQGIFPIVNTTLVTSGRRAMLECQPITAVENSTSWLKEWYLKKQTNSTRASDNKTEPILALRQRIFNETDPDYGPDFFETGPGVVGCCVNNTGNTGSNVSVGYWSSPWGYDDPWPHIGGQWPRKFTVKWLHGPAWYWPEGYDVVNDKGNVDEWSYRPAAFYHKEPPSLQAISCTPRIQSAEARITIDYVTNAVYDINIIGEPKTIVEPWSDPYVTRDEEFPKGPDERMTRMNVSMSYGVNFMSALLAASNLNMVTEGMAGASGGGSDETFKIRDNRTGINMDLMTYAMYHLAERNSDALLDAKTLEAHAQTTFQTFFQHFLSIQPDADAAFSPWQFIGQGSSDNEPQFGKYEGAKDTRNIEATVSSRIEVLRISKPASWVAMVILVWLLLTTLAVILLQRSILRRLVRRIESIADVLVLMAGSQSLLMLLREQDFDHLRRDKNIMTRLGWFRGRDGKTRWGIEVMGDVGLGAVQWLDKPDADYEMYGKEERRTLLGHSDATPK